MRAPLFLIGGALAVLTGCTSSVLPPGEVADAELSPTATAVVVVEGSSANEGSRSDVVARFVRARNGAVDDDALRMVGASVDFPAVGGCGALGSPRPTSPRAIALLDVGSVTLAAGAGETSESVATLQARQLPDVADLISGVVYSMARRDGTLPSKGRYLLRVEGTSESEIGPFVIAATSPGEPTNVLLAGDDGHAGAVSFAPDAAVDLTGDAGGGADDISGDLAATSAAPITRCLFVDSGEARIGAAAFGGLEDGTVTVHRLHREPFEAQGVKPGEVRFDFARVVPFTRR